MLNHRKSTLLSKNHFGLEPNLCYTYNISEALLFQFAKHFDNKINTCPTYVNALTQFTVLWICSQRLAVLLGLTSLIVVCSKQTEPRKSTLELVFNLAPLCRLVVYFTHKKNGGDCINMKWSQLLSSSAYKRKTQICISSD